MFSFNCVANEFVLLSKICFACSAYCVQLTELKEGSVNMVAFRPNVYIFGKTSQQSGLLRVFRISFEGLLVVQGLGSDIIFGGWETVGELSAFRWLFGKLLPQKKDPQKKSCITCCCFFSL